MHLISEKAASSVRAARISIIERHAKRMSSTSHLHSSTTAIVAFLLWMLRRAFQYLLCVVFLICLAVHGYSLFGPTNRLTELFPARSCASDVSVRANPLQVEEAAAATAAAYQGLSYFWQVWMPPMYI